MPSNPFDTAPVIRCDDSRGWRYEYPSPSPIICPIMPSHEPEKTEEATQPKPCDLSTSEGCPSWDRTRTLLIQSQETASASTAVNPLTAPLSTSGATGDPIGEGLEQGSATHSHHESHQVAESLVARATTRTARSSDEAWLDIGVDRATTRKPHPLATKADTPCPLCGFWWTRPGLVLSNPDVDEIPTVTLCAHCKCRRGLPAEGNQTERSS